MEALTPLNLATGCWLPIFLAACEGVQGTGMAQVMRRAPFDAISPRLSSAIRGVAALFLHDRPIRQQ